jgi:hypothetical protein
MPKGGRQRKGSYRIGTLPDEFADRMEAACLELQHNIDAFMVFASQQPELSETASSVKLVAELLEEIADYIGMYNRDEWTLTQLDFELGLEARSLEDSLLPELDVDIDLWKRKGQSVRQRWTSWRRMLTIKDSAWRLHPMLDGDYSDY